MPILKKEVDISPEDLLSEDYVAPSEDAVWWACYTNARQEKNFMRKLVARGIPFYGPTIAKRYKSPAGRVRTSYIPLFSNYVFMLADDSGRMIALESNCLSSCKPIGQQEEFLAEIRQIQHALEAGVELLPEANLEKGQKVRVLNGPFKNYEGVVIRREGRTRLLLTLNFLQQGVSAELDQCQLQKI